MKTLGGRGEGPGEFRSAEAIALLPDDRLVVRDSGRNLVHVFGPGAGDVGVLRIERATNPVPVSDAEREYERNDVMRYMRGRYPDWSWNGPHIPDHKPYFKALLTGKDGRIWVQLSSEGQPAENEDRDPDDPWSDPVTWPEPLRYDVFEPGGTYLGVVNAPDEFTRFRLPVFDGDHVWAITRDELDVEEVVRYRIVVGGDGV